jgi:hypothetical protein
MICSCRFCRIKALRYSLIVVRFSGIGEFGKMLSAASACSSSLFDIVEMAWK